MSIIAVDIGNTTVTVGILKGAEIDIYRMSSRPVLEQAEYRKRFLNFMDISRVAGASGSVICSVVPEVVSPVSSALGKITGKEPLVVDSSFATGLVLDVENPEALGTDRIASAMGALKIGDPPIAIVDFGTATTVNFLDSAPEGDPVFRGGAILPGLGLMGHALAASTSLLPRVREGGEVKLPGRNTEECIRAGIAFATAGGVERILEEVEQAQGHKYSLVATGGMLDYAAGFIRRSVKREPALTLRGLFEMYEKSTCL